MDGRGFTYTTSTAVRQAFWRDHPQFTRRAGWSQNSYGADTRMAFCDYVETLARNGDISADLAQRVTL